MTSSIVSTADGPPPRPKAATSAAPPPKKKRKRTGTGGANDDCFACSSRGVKCDRKRPYCTQCIDIGKECSGYKTTLTWGVGVASRGKLRGLSCPVANKNADGSDVSPMEMEDRRRRKSSVSQNKKDVSSGSQMNNGSTPKLKEEPVFPQSYPTSSGPALQQSLGYWQPHDQQQHLYARRADGVRQELAPLEPIQTTREPPPDGIPHPKSGRSLSSYSDNVFYSPMDYPHTPASLPFPEPLKQSVSAPFLGQTITTTPMNTAQIESFLDRLQSRVDPLHNGVDMVQMSSQPENVRLAPFDGSMYGASQTPLTPHSTSTYNPVSGDFQLDDEDAVEGSNDLALVNARFSSPFFHIAPRLQSLMNYYDRNICPYLVAFDSPENPYRQHVLQLAFQNDGLQHAIAALAINNHRMRTKELRQLGFVGQLGNTTIDIGTQDPSGPSQEESCYKQMSIDNLNMQLTDARAAQDDSVLATLLILCLFHVCDSGFSKFKTQLAGVQKLLSLRQPNTQSDFTRWVEMFFTWFDVMTSTVNDREVQIKAEPLAMLDYNVNLGALEQFSGCDGRLFKLIAQLGTLNVLAQGRPVRSVSGDQPPASLQRPQMWFRKRPNRKAGSLLPSDYDNVDGNGWGTPIISSDEDADGSADEDVRFTDRRRHFWSAWHDIRNRLEAWQMSSPMPDFAEATAEQRDMYHINEFFRVAALLYTERLGNPLLPSSHDQLQNLVKRALAHLSALQVTSCVNKFLLWPLFIIGTECVDEEHRDIIRTRCRDLSEESGFYNNMSSLYVLERVWMEVGSNVRGQEAEEVIARRRDSEASRPGRYGQAFRWRKAMDRVDGEYIVI